MFLVFFQYNGGVRVGGDRFDGGGLNPGGRPGRGASPSGGFGPGGSIPLAGQHLSSSGGETDGHVPTASEIEAARPQVITRFLGGELKPGLDPRKV